MKVIILMLALGLVIGCGKQKDPSLQSKETPKSQSTPKATKFTGEMVKAALEKATERMSAKEKAALKKSFPVDDPAEMSKMAEVLNKTLDKGEMKLKEISEDALADYFSRLVGSRNFAKAQAVVCRNNLRSINDAILQWQIGKKSSRDTKVTLEDIARYFEEFPSCPSGGKYKLTTVGTAPICEGVGHEHLLLYSTPSQSKGTPEPQNNIVERAIRKSLKKPTGELTNADLEKVKALNLSDTKITNEGLVEVGKLQQLSSLGLGYTKISSQGLTELAKLKQLKVLNLWGATITDTGLKELAKCKKLEKLSLQETQVTKAGVAELKKALPKCSIRHNAKK